MANQENTKQSFNPRENAINNIAKSVANIEESLSDILSAESKKIKAVIPNPPHSITYDTSEESSSSHDSSSSGESYESGYGPKPQPKPQPCDNLCCYLAINNSVKDMVKSITMLEIVLNIKLDFIANCLCPNKPDHVCKDDHKKDGCK